MPIYLIVILALVGLGLICLIISFIFSGLIIHSHRQPIVKTPDEYGCEFEEVSFESRDGLTLKGWFIPGQNAAGGSQKAIVLTHPMFFNRHGFLARNQGWLPLFKTDVDLLRVAQALNQAGYAVLMFDFRNHGESDSGISGVGLTEYQDVLGAIDYLAARPDLGSPQIGLVSFCMGADASMIALSEGKGELEAVCFLVAVQPVSASVFIRSYMRDVYTPLSLFLVPIVDRLCQWRGGYAFEAMSPLSAARDIRVPTLYVQAASDPWTDLDEVRAFYETTAGPKELWLIEGEMRRFEGYDYVGKHPQRVLAFARRHFSSGAGN